MTKDLVDAETFARVSLQQSQHQILRLISDHAPALLGVRVRVKHNRLSDCAEGNLLFVETLTVKRLLTAQQNVEDNAEGPAVY